MVWETGVQSQVNSYQRHKNGTWCCLAEIHYYKVWIQGMELHPPQHLSVVAIAKGAFGSSSTKVTNFYICKLIDSQ